jgi:hypothetical protein
VYIRELTIFFSGIQHDEWITPFHVSIYIALFENWNLNQFQNPISISRRKIMKMSKVTAYATYHKCMRELVAGGYISYIPSYHPVVGSLVYFNQF